MKFIRVLFFSIMSNYSQQLLQPLVWMYFIVLVHRGNKCWISWPKLILTIIWGRLQDLNSLPLIMGAVGICIPVCLILMCSHLSDHLLWALFNYTVDNYDSFSGPSFIFIHCSTKVVAELTTSLFLLWQHVNILTSEIFFFILKGN